MTKIEIAKTFSNGNFEEIYPFLAENAEWNVVEETIFNGKQAIIANCKQVANYFQTVTTNFKTQYIVAENNMVVVNGTAEFIKGVKIITFVSACDIYEFNEDNEILKITSYCIERK